MSIKPIKEILNDQVKFTETARIAFETVDKDKSGKIEADELGLILNQISLDFGAELPTKEDLLEIMNHLDEDKNGSICFDEFCVLIRDIMEAISEDKCYCLCNCRKKMCQCQCTCD